MTDVDTLEWYEPRVAVAAASAHTDEVAETSRERGYQAGEIVAKWADYQLITTIAKKVGGPRVLLLAVAAGGALTLKAGEVMVAKGMSMKRAFDVRAEEAARSHVYRVAENADAGGGLTLHAGDEFRVLARDDDTILIEVVGGEGNPWYVSTALLLSISNLTLDDE